MRYLSQKPEETRKIAALFSRRLRGGEIVLFKGGLGCGKTTFMKGVARFLGVRKTIQSPTFVIVKIYPLQPNQLCPQLTQLVHVDAYRLKSRHELVELGVVEWLGRPETVTFVENPGKLFASFHPVKTITIKILSDQKRSLTFN